MVVRKVVEWWSEKWWNGGQKSGGMVVRKVVGWSSEKWCDGGMLQCRNLADGNCYISWKMRGLVALAILRGAGKFQHPCTHQIGRSGMVGQSVSQ